MGRGGKGVVVVDLWELRPSATPRNPAKDRRWQVRAWCPITQRYRTRNVLDHELPDAEAWAARTNKRLSLGQETTGRLALEQLGSEYVEELKGRGVRDGTWGEVERVIAEAVAAGVTDLKAPTLASKVRKWLVEIQGEGRALGPETRYRYLGHLKAVTRFAVLGGKLPRDPLAVVKRPRLPKKSRRTLTIDELRLLAPRGGEADQMAAAWLWATIMAYTGCRASEVLAMRWQAFDWGGRRVKVIGKGAKGRAVPLQLELVGLLKPTAQLAGHVLPKAFRDLGYKNQVRWFKRLLRDRGIATERRSPHALRHSWVAIMLATGENAHAVQEMAGHESSRTTELYARTQSEYRDAIAGWERGVLQFLPAVTQASATATKAVN